MNLVNHSCNAEPEFYEKYLAWSLYQMVIKNENDPYFISDYIGITARELQETCQKMFDQNWDWDEEENLRNPNWDEEQHLRSCLLNLIIEKVNSCCFGSGMNDELFEERKQETLLQIFEYLLSEEEVMLIKDKCGFFENFEPYSSQCEKCGMKIDALQSVRGMDVSSKELCGLCLDSSI